MTVRGGAWARCFCSVRGILQHNPLRCALPALAVQLHRQRVPAVNAPALAAHAAYLHGAAARPIQHVLSFPLHVAAE